MKTKLYAKKTLSVFMAVMMLMSAWVFVPGEHNHASAESADTIGATNQNAVSSFTDASFNTAFTTVSGNFHGDNASTMASRGYYKNVLYSPHFPASNNNLNNSDAGVYFGTLGSTADGARVWYPETTLIWDGSTTPQIPILFDIDSNNNNRVGVKNVYISSGANGLAFKDSYWTAKSECGKDTNYYTHFTFDWIMQNNSGNYWISTSSSNDKESMCSSKGYWDIYGTYLQYTGGSFGSGSTYYKAITPTWVCRTGSNYTGTTNKTIYVIDYVPLKNALNNVKTLINEVKSNPAKYTTSSVSALVSAANKLIDAKPNNYINSSVNDVYNWNTAVSSALSAYNSAKNLAVQQYNVKFEKTDGTVVYDKDYNYGTSVNLSSLAADYSNTVEQYNDNNHQLYQWNIGSDSITITADQIITETPGALEGHSYDTDGDGTTDKNDVTGSTEYDHKWTCTVCGHVKTQTHTYTSSVTTEPTCEGKGVRTYTCSGCGKSYTEEIAAKGHDFNSDIYTEIVPGLNGTHAQKCVRCDAYGWGTVKDDCRAHDFDRTNDGKVDAADAETRASTCQQAGWEKYTCEICKATWTKNLEVAKHTITKTEAKNVANKCGAVGYDAFWKCSDCGKIWKDEGLTSEISVYEYTDVDGVQVPDELVKYGPAHKFDGTCVNAKNGADGSHYYQCSICNGAVYGVGDVENATVPHNFTESSTDSTCTVQGVKTYTCKDCKYSYTEKLPLEAHKMTKIPAVAAECGKAGNNEYYHCETCGKYYKDEAGTTETTVAAETIKALEHTWTKHHDYDTVKTEATCQSAAVYFKHCDYCKVKIEGLIYPYGAPDTVNGHDFSGAIRKDDDGTHSYKCVVEGCDEYGNATTCNFTVPVEDVASTCHTYGYTVTKCETCGKENRVEKTTLDSTNHDGEEETRDEVPATCAQEGYSGDVYCLGCNTLKVKGSATDKDPSNHADMKDYDGKEATCQTEGYTAYRYCAYCDTYEVEKEVIGKKDHSFTNYSTNNNGTHTAVCDTCKAEDGEIATDTKPCEGGTANCVDKKVCTVCNTAYGEVDGENHKTVKTVDKVPATCQKEGTEAYRYCDACDKALEEIVKIEKLAHTYSAWTKTDGEDKHTRYCTTCVEKADENLTIDVQSGDCSGGNANCVEKAKCSVCKSEYGATNPDVHKTTANHLVNYKEATCQAPGYTGDYLYDCCDALKEEGEAIAQLEHTYDLEVEGSRIPATCIAKGEVTYKCSTCVESEGVTAATQKKELAIDSKNHASEETVIKNQKDATCESDGNTGDIYHKCCYDENKTAAENKKALIQKGTVIKANGQHVYGTAVPEYMIKEIAETKDEDGKVIKREIVLVDETPDYAAKIAARHADGKWYHAEICTICYDLVYSACYTYEHTYNCVDTDECEVCSGLCSLVDAGKHKADLVEVTEGAKAATCVSDGVKSYYKCADCNKTYFDEAGKKPFDPASEEDKAALVIDKSTVAHTIDWENPDEEQAGNCGTSGYKLYKCSVDGCNYETTVNTGVASNAHTWKTEYDVIDEPTCGENGYKAIKCEICGATKSNSTVIIPATEAHDFDKNKDGKVDRNDAAVTEGINCQTPGTLTYTCQVCGATKVETDTEGVSAHVWGDWTTKGGDCSTGVLLERVCGVCGATEQERKDTDAHQLELYMEVQPTAQQDGYRIEKCANCGFEKRTELPWNGSGEGGEGGEGGETPDTPDTDKHIVDETIYTVHEKADCRHGEIRRYTCILCGEMVEREVGEPTDHVWMTQAAEVATCTRPGHSEYKRCLICQAEKDREDIAATGHNDGDGNGKCDDCNSAYYNDGEGTKTCGCICHKEGIFMRIIYKIVSFFWKLFKIGHSCDCGAVHY